MGVGLKRSNYERVLLQLYLRKYKGDEPMMGFSKSHYPGCEWVTERQRMPIIMPDSTPPSLISCNACLFRKRYMISVVCNPLKEGWPNEHECDLCDYGWDCETWIRVEGLVSWLSRCFKSGGRMPSIQLRGETWGWFPL